MERRDRASASASESRLGLDPTRACCIWEHTTAGFRRGTSGPAAENIQALSCLCASPVPGGCSGQRRTHSCPLLCDMWRSPNTFKPSEKLFFWVCSHFSRSCFTAGSTIDWFSMQRGVSLCRSKPRFIRAYPQRCTVTHGPAGAL